MDAGINTGSNQLSDAGFTLIELLIVVTVLSILTISVGLSMSFGRVERQAMDDAKNFQVHFARLQASAIHKQKPHGIKISSTGWRVVQFDNVLRKWKAAGREIRWRGSVDFRKTGVTGFSGTAFIPDVVFLPDGRSTAFNIRFVYKETFSICANDGWTGVLCGQS